MRRAENEWIEPIRKGSLVMITSEHALIRPETTIVYHIHKHWKSHWLLIPVNLLSGISVIKLYGLYTANKLQYGNSAEIMKTLDTASSRRACWT